MTKERTVADQIPEVAVVGGNLATLGKELRAGSMELKTAAELANIYGKELKAQALMFDMHGFLKNR